MAPSFAEAMHGAMTPGRRYATLLTIGFVAIAVWTSATTLYVDWMAYSPLPWGDHWDYWLQYVRQSGLSPQMLFGAHNEHRIATSRVLFWIDQQVFSARNSFLYGSAVAVQLAHATLLWRLGIRSGPDPKLSLALGALAMTAAFSGQQFTNFTWAFQVQFVMVFLFAHASFASLGQASGWLDRDEGGREHPWWLAAAVMLAWLSTYSMSNGLLVWPLLVLLSLALGMSWRAVATLSLSGVIAWLLYFNGLASTGSMIEGIYQLPRSLLYALVVLGLPVDETGSAIMRTFGLPAPQYPGLGGDSLATQAWRPMLAATVGTAGVAYLLRVVRQAVHSERRTNGAVLVLIHCALFPALTAVLVGIGRSPRFDIVAVMQSRYATPALLFWACLAILFLSRSGLTSPSPPTSRTTESRLEAVLLAAVLTVGVNQPSKLAYVRGYVDHLGEVEEAMTANVYSQEIWGRVYWDPAALVPIVDYFKRERLAMFSKAQVQWQGQLVASLFTVSAGCVGHVDEITPLASDARPGVRVRGWAWDDRDAETADTVVITDPEGRILGIADTTSRRDDVTAAMPTRVRTPWVGWRGFAPAGSASRVQAYLVRDEDGTACLIGSAP